MSLDPPKNFHRDIHIDYWFHSKSGNIVIDTTTYIYGDGSFRMKTDVWKAYSIEEYEDIKSFLEFI